MGVALGQFKKHFDPPQMLTTVLLNVSCLNSCLLSTLHEFAQLKYNINNVLPLLPAQLCISCVTRQGGEVPTGSQLRSESETFMYISHLFSVELKEHSICLSVS